MENFYFVPLGNKYFNILYDLDMEKWVLKAFEPFLKNSSLNLVPYLETFNSKMERSFLRKIVPGEFSLFLF